MTFSQPFFDDACSQVRRTGSLFSCTFLARRAIANGMLDKAIALARETQENKIRWHTRPFPGFEEQKRSEMLRLSQILAENKPAMLKALRKLGELPLVRDMLSWQIPSTSSQDAGSNIILEEEKIGKVLENADILGDDLTDFLVHGHRDLRERKGLIQDEKHYEKFYDKYLAFLCGVPAKDRIDAIYESQRSKKHFETRQQIQRILSKSGCRRQHLEFLTATLHNFDFLYHYVTDEPQFPEKPTLASKAKNALRRVKDWRKK